MKMRTIFVILLTALFSGLFSQTSELYIPLNIRQAYTHKTRDISGKPGINYWQNKPIMT